MTNSGKSKNSPNIKHYFQVVDVPWAMKKVEEATGDVHNRTVSDLHVADLAREMTEGRWSENGVPIILDQYGKLLDGQHRLWAVIQSQVTIRVLIVEGVDRKSALPTIDCNNRKRSLADTLVMDSPIEKPISNPGVVQAAVKWLYTYRTRNIFMGRSKASVGKLRELLTKEPGLVDSLEAANSLVGLMPSRSLSVFAHYIFSTRDQDKADQFLSQIASGAQLRKDSPALAFREKVIEYQIKKERRTMEHICFVMFRAWLSFEAELPLARLVWRRQASEKRPPDPFPYLEDYPRDVPALRKRLQQKAKRTTKKSEVS